MRTFLAALLLALVAPPAPAADALFDHPAEARALQQLLAGVATELHGARTLRGAYVQRKHLPELPQPLVAQGDFLFVRDRGIRWRTTLPFPSELVITPRSLTTRDGGSEQTVSADRQPAIRMVGRIFLAVFALDFDALGELFTLHGLAAPGGAWRLGLVPKQSAGSLHSIEVDGRERVERVILREGEADVTEIELHDTVASPAPPSAADLAPFSS